MSQAAFAAIAKEAAAPDRGNRLRHGRGKAAVLSMKMHSGFTGQTFIASHQVIESQPIKDGIEPNPAGSTWDYVQPMNKLGAGGRVKAYILKVLNAKGDNVTEEDALRALTSLCGLSEGDAKAVLAEGLKDVAKSYKLEGAEARYTFIAGLLTDSDQHARGVVLSYETQDTKTKTGADIIVPVFTATGERIDLDS